MAVRVAMAMAMAMAMAILRCGPNASCVAGSLSHGGEGGGPLRYKIGGAAMAMRLAMAKVVPGPVRDRWARKLVATRPCLWAELLMKLIKVVQPGFQLW